MKTSIIIHGHFYQPPRENPWTSLLPKQIDSSRYSDWNEAITDSCYKANTHSRYLDFDGSIKSLNNNYRYISWNFGPTLLNWFESNNIEMIQKLQEADEFSIKVTGHGNAIAQGFGHSILPLDTPRNRKLQISWAIEDFKSKFHRMPEGFWCPECAINEDVIDSLSELGISFVILSPWQAKSVEGETSIPFDEAFWIKGHKSKIAAFFYNSELASSVSFGHILRDADAFYRRLVEIKNQYPKPLKLIHYATDGEIYGHHEPYGDMALAALIKKINKGEDYELTNYAAFLEANPPRRFAILSKGEQGKGTSWSCCHGVSRWYKDCGCSTGGLPGWNQKWRTPLRDSFNHLNNTLSSVFDKEIQRLFPERGSDFPDQLLLSYSEVVSLTTSTRHFLERNSIPEDKMTEVAKLLFGMKNLLYSFTSCGWFFNDISGIEPKQNICYALFAIKMFWHLIDHSVLDDFLEDLSHAQSNIPSELTAKEMAIKVINGVEGSAEAAMAAYLNHLIDDKLFLRRYGCFRIEYLSDSDAYVLSNSITLENHSYRISLDAPNKTLLLANLSAEPVFNILSNKTPLSSKRYKFSDLPPRLRSQLLLRINQSTCIHEKNLVDEIGHSIQMLALLSKTISVQNYTLCIHAMKQFFNSSIDHLAEIWPTEKNNLSEIISSVHDQQFEDMRSLLSDCLNRIALEILSNGYSEQKLLFCYDFLKTIRNAGVEPDITLMQDVVYPLLLDKRYDFPLLKKVGIDLNFSRQLDREQ